MQGHPEFCNAPPPGMNTRTLFWTRLRPGAERTLTAWVRAVKCSSVLLRAQARGLGLEVGQEAWAGTHSPGAGGSRAGSAAR